MFGPLLYPTSHSHPLSLPPAFLVKQVGDVRVRTRKVCLEQGQADAPLPALCCVPQGRDEIPKVKRLQGLWTDTLGLKTK